MAFQISVERKYSLAVANVTFELGIMALAMSTMQCQQFFFRQYERITHLY
jgi:hypothetical protein